MSSGFASGGAFMNCGRLCSLVCASLLSVGVLPCAGGRPAVSSGGQAGALPEPIVTTPLPEDSLARASSHGDSAVPADDIELMRAAYRLSRRAADPNAPSTIQADAVAEEAATLALIGEREDAAALWLEAISLLEAVKADTSSSRTTQPGGP